MINQMFGRPQTLFQFSIGPVRHQSSQTFVQLDICPVRHFSGQSAFVELDIFPSIIFRFQSDIGRVTHFVNSDTLKDVGTLEHNFILILYNVVLNATDASSELCLDHEVCAYHNLSSQTFVRHFTIICRFTLVDPVRKSIIQLG